MANPQWANEFREYLRLCRTLYIEGAVSGIDGSILARMGGALAIVGVHAASLRVERNGYLGFIDREREPADVRKLAVQRWSQVEREILAEIGAGHAPSQALTDVMARYGTTPHTFEQVGTLSTRVADASGGAYTYPWILAVQEAAARIHRTLETMTGSTFGAIAASAYVMVNARNWQDATAQEWDRAFAVAGVVAGLEQLGGAAMGMRQAREGFKAVPYSGPVSPPIARAAAAPEGKPAAALPAPVQRSTVDRGTAARGTTVRGTTAPGTGARGTHPPSVPGASGSTDAKGSPGNRGITSVVPNEFENSAFGPSTYHEGGNRDIRARQHRKGPFAGQPYASLDAIARNPTPAQKAAIQRFMGRFPAEVRTVWDSVARLPRAQRNLALTRGLWSSPKPVDRARAKKVGDANYNWCRGEFWAQVREQMKTNPALKQAFLDLGVKFGPGKKTVPYWELPNGTRELLTLEHIEQRQDNPTRSIDGSNLIFSPANENSHTLEAIRRYDVFQQHAP